MGKWKHPPITYRENETTKVCDSREKLSDDSSASHPKAGGMMAT